MSSSNEPVVRVVPSIAEKQPMDYREKVILVCLGFLSVVFAIWLIANNFNTWGWQKWLLIVLVCIPIGWKLFTIVHDRHLHHKDRKITHDFSTTQLELARIAIANHHNVELVHTDHLGRTQSLRTISPFTIPNAPVTIKELNYGQEQEQLPAPSLPVAPPFASIASQIKPGRLFLAQGQSGPIWGDITDLLSTLDVGRPGTGKSTLLRDVCGQVLLIGGKPIIFDPHGSILDDLGSSFECAESPRDIIDYSKSLDAHLTKRLFMRREGQRDFKPVLLLVDEMPIIASMAIEALPAIRRIVLEGRKVGMFALISGQGVPASILGGTLVRDAMASRYVFCTTPQQARMAGLENETAKSMMSILEQAGPGKAVLSTANRKPEIVAIPDTTTDDIRMILQRNSMRNVPVPVPVPYDFRNNQEQPLEPFYESVPDVPENETDMLKNVSSQEREQIINLARAGVPRREMCLALGKGKHYYDVVKQVLDQEGL